MDAGKLKYVKNRIDTIVNENQGKLKYEIYRLKEQLPQDVKEILLLGLANSSIPGKKFLESHDVYIPVDVVKNEICVPRLVLKFSDICNKGLSEKINKLKRQVNCRIVELQSIVSSIKNRGTEFYDKVVLGQIELTIVSELKLFEKEIKTLVKETLM